MGEISAGMVKELRAKTGAGIMDCKKALGECGGELEKAVDYFLILSDDGFAVF